MTPTDIYIGEPHTPTLTGMNVAGSWLNALTVTYALKDSMGATVAGGTGSMPYIGASNGNYSGTILGSVTALLSELQDYRLDITYTGTFSGLRRLYLISRYREAS